MIYNGVLVTGVQKSNPVNHKFTKCGKKNISLQDTKYNSLCYTVGPYYVSVYTVYIC